MGNYYWFDGFARERDWPVMASGDTHTMYRHKLLARQPTLLWLWVLLQASALAFAAHPWAHGAFRLPWPLLLVL
jgi:hypothetical protein